MGRHLQKGLRAEQEDPTGAVHEVAHSLTSILMGSQMGPRITVWCGRSTGGTYCRVFTPGLQDRGT